MRILHSLTLSTALVALTAGTAHAKPGYSAYAGVNNQTCGNCHGGGAVPTVSFKVAPAGLVRGQSAAFTFGVMGSLARTQIDIAALDKNGVSIPITPDNVTTQTANNEVIPKGNSFNGASKDYSFSINAPNNAVSPITIYAVGMASNGNGTGGDGVAKTTLQLAVTGGTVVGDAGSNTDSGSKPDASSGGSDAGGTSSSGGTTSGSSSSGSVSSSSSGGATSGGASSGSGDGTAADGSDDFNDGSGGCSTTDSSRTGMSGMVGVLLALGLVARARRRA